MRNIYYQDELRYLREVGPEFQRTNPEIARYLSDAGTDPDVERLLEGVAFLCGRIREKLDDEYPEFTAGLMGLLWPHYLRPVPSMTIVEMLPDIEALQAPLLVPAGAEFASTAIDGTRCRYRSAWGTTLRPMVLRDAKLETASAQPVRLVLTFAVPVKAKLKDMRFDSLRLFLAGDPRTAFTLYLLLAAHTEQVTISNGSARHDRPVQHLGRSAVAAAGLDRGDAVLPYPPHSFAGYRLLQEYLTFKERFLFVDVRGMNRVVEKVEITDTIEVAITFNRRLDSLPIVSRENVRLHCVPAINLFSHAADPIRIQHDRVQYLLQPSLTGITSRQHAEIYSVDQVTGLVRGETLRTREYPPFYSFRHTANADPQTATYYQTHLWPRQRSADRIGVDTFLSFVVGGDSGATPGDEAVSVELTCTNADLPTELRVGDICERTDGSPAVKFRNIVKPTTTISPPLGKALHWRLLSHMSLNYVSLADADRLRQLLRVYDFVSEHDAQRALAHERMLEGIQRFSCGYRERIVRGAPIRGISCEIDVHEDHFAGEGDAYLFATIINQFLGLYVTLNGYSELVARLVRTGQIYRFAPRWGEQHTPADLREREAAHA